MITKDEIINKLRDLKPALYKEYSIKDIGLFGSFADGTNDENSNIDILVDLEKSIGWKFFTLELYLENILGRKIDLVTKNALKEQLKENILKQVKFI